MANKPSRLLLGSLAVLTLAAVPISAIVTRYPGIISIQLYIPGSLEGTVQIEGISTSALPPSQ